MSYDTYIACEKCKVYTDYGNHYNLGSRTFVSFVGAFIRNHSEVGTKCRLTTYGECHEGHHLQSADDWFNKVPSGWEPVHPTREQLESLIQEEIEDYEDPDYNLRYLRDWQVRLRKDSTAAK